MADVVPAPPAEPFTGAARNGRAQWQTPLGEQQEQLLLPPRPMSDAHQVAARMAAVQRALDEHEKTALREELIIVQRQARADVLQERFAGLETQRALEAQLISVRAELLISERAREAGTPRAAQQEAAPPPPPPQAQAAVAEVTAPQVVVPAAPADAEADTKRAEETAARKAKLAEMEQRLKDENEDDEAREARLAELERLMEEDKVADAEREALIVELRAAATAAASTYAAAHADAIAALRTELEESKATLRAEKDQVLTSSATAAAEDAEADAKRSEEAAARKAKLAAMEERLKDEDEDDEAREARLAELERLMEEDKAADVEREALIVELRATHSTAASEHEAVVVAHAEELAALRSELEASQKEHAEHAQQKAALVSTRAVFMDNLQCNLPPRAAAFEGMRSVSDTRLVVGCGLAACCDRGGGGSSGGRGRQAGERGGRTESETSRNGCRIGG